MARMELRREIIGATLHLTRSEVYGLVNTGERLGELVDDGKLKAVASMFSDAQAAEELESFYAVVKAAAPMIHADFTDRTPDAAD